MHSEDTSIFLLTKFEVAERQLNMAINLFFQEQDPVSIHTLAEAASQILYDISSDYGAKSIIRENKSIRPDRKKEWFTAIHSSRNFFKHAERDKYEIHEFKDEFNYMSILDAVNMYISIKTKWTPESLIFYSWFGIKYPHLMIKDTETYTLTNKIISGPQTPSPKNKKFFSDVIRRARGGNELTNVVLYSGLGK